MLASIGLSLRIPVAPYSPLKASPRPRHELPGRDEVLPAELPPLPGGVRLGEGVGDCTKHHCFTNAAYVESLASEEVGADTMPFARCFSDSDAVGSAV